MRATLFYAVPGLGTDELSTELLTLAITFCGIVGGREEPNTEERHANGEQRRVFIRENGFFVTENLHPYRTWKAG